MGIDTSLYPQPRINKGDSHLGLGCSMNEGSLRCEVEGAGRPVFQLSSAVVLGHGPSLNPTAEMPRDSHP